VTQARFLFKSLIIGLWIGGALFILLSQLTGQHASRQSFSIFGLLFAIATVGWSVALASTNTINSFAQMQGEDIDWAEEDVRRAMTVLCCFGIGGMLGVWMIEALLFILF
jgi:hypothetical protein